MDELKKQQASLMSVLHELKLSQTTQHQQQSRAEEEALKEIEAEIGESTKAIEAVRQQIATTQSASDKAAGEAGMNAVERLRTMRKGLADKTRKTTDALKDREVVSFVTPYTPHAAGGGQSITSSRRLFTDLVEDKSAGGALSVEMLMSAMGK